MKKNEKHQLSEYGIRLKERLTAIVHGVTSDKGASRRALVARRFARRLHAMSSAVVVFAI